MPKPKKPIKRFKSLSDLKDHVTDLLEEKPLTLDTRVPPPITTRSFDEDISATVKADKEDQYMGRGLWKK